MVIGSAWATLVITFDNGGTTVMHQPEAGDQLNPKPLGSLSLAPGQSVQQAVGWSTGIPGWFQYPSFSGPGTYGVALAARAHDTAEAIKYFELAQKHYNAALATKSVGIRENAEMGLGQATSGLERASKRDR